MISYRVPPKLRQQALVSPEVRSGHIQPAVISEHLEGHDAVGSDTVTESVSSDEDANKDEAQISQQ